jgi:hypothetical protein
LEISFLYQLPRGHAGSMEAVKDTKIMVGPGRLIIMIIEESDKSAKMMISPAIKLNGNAKD